MWGLNDRKQRFTYGRKRVNVHESYVEHYTPPYQPQARDPDWLKRDSCCERNLTHPEADRLNREWYQRFKIYHWEQVPLVPEPVIVTTTSTTTTTTTIAPENRTKRTLAKATPLPKVNYIVATKLICTCTFIIFLRCYIYI